MPPPKSYKIDQANTVIYELVMKNEKAKTRNSRRRCSQKLERNQFLTLKLAKWIGTGVLSPVNTCTTFLLKVCYKFGNHILCMSTTSYNKGGNLIGSMQFIRIAETFVLLL